jgi:predicted metalloprotease with PDZ domain
MHNGPRLLTRAAHSLALLLIFLLASTGIELSAQSAPTPSARAARYVDAGRAERLSRYAEISTARLEGPMRYRCRIDPAKDLLELRVRAQIREAGNLVLVIPAWNPGSYTIRDYGQVTDDMRLGEHALERVQPGTWIVRGVPAGDTEIVYTAKASSFAERSFRSRGQRKSSQGAYSYQINGAKLFVHEFSHVTLPCELEFEVPEDWDIATGMDGAPGTLQGFVAPGRWRFVAPDYDVFADCPLKLGLFESFAFELEGVPFEIALAGASPSLGNRQEFAARVRRISAFFADFIDGLPFDRYVYLFTVPGGGGLEHLNSTTVGLMSLKGSKPGRPTSGDSVIAHEFFHAWNVKRLRPRALGPFDYTGPNRSTALWFCEGVTSYYAWIAMVRTRLVEPADYWRHIARRYSALRGRSVRRQISVADSSWTVWDGRYWGATDRIDYYLKGECLGFLLDIEIRRATNNERSFDDVIRALYQQVEQSGVGFAEDDILRTTERISGRSFERWFDAYVYGTRDLPVLETLRKAGLDATWSRTSRRPSLRITERPGADELARRIRNGLMGR